MSAYQVTPDTIDLIVSALFDWDPEPHITLWVEDTPVVHTDAFRDPSKLAACYGDGQCWRLTRQDKTEVGRELIAANLASLVARYGEAHKLGGYGPEDYVFRLVPRGPNVPGGATVGQAFGALSCYRYQTCEASDEGRSLWGALVRKTEAELLNNYVRMSHWDFSRPMEVA